MRADALNLALRVLAGCRTPPHFAGLSAIGTAGPAQHNEISHGGDGPVAYGLLTYGQGSSAESAYAYDQLPLFSAKQWVSLPYHPEAVKAQRIGAPLVLTY